MIALRLAYVPTSSYLHVCFVGGFELKSLTIFLAIVFLLSVPASLSDQSKFTLVECDNVIGLAIVFVVFGPIYFIKQYILGFPERDLIVLKPPVQTSTGTLKKIARVNELSGQSAIVTATLRPIGRIQSNGSQFDAISFDGSLIEAGRLVQVADVQNRLFVVHPVPMPA